MKKETEIFLPYSKGEEHKLRVGAGYKKFMEDKPTEKIVYTENDYNPKDYWMGEAPLFPPLDVEVKIDWDKLASKRRSVLEAQGKKNRIGYQRKEN